MNPDNNYNSTFLFDYLISESYQWRLTPKIIKECNKVIASSVGYEYITGEILEIYVRYNIQNQLKESSYKWRDRKPKMPKTYYMKRHYQTTRIKNNGGIDIYINILDEYLNNYHIKIEISNWGRYEITKRMFETRIAEKYTKYSKDKCSMRLEVIPYHHLEKIMNWCDDLDIIVIPIDQQLLEQDIIRQQVGI
jgi:hypothetical protein